MNMHRMITKLTSGLLILFVCLYALSCTKEENREFNQARMFTPGRISINSEEKQATLTWNPSLFTEGKSIQYTVELAKDSSFQTIEYSVVTDTAGVTITDDVLKPRQKYVARVKANAFNSTPESNWILSGQFSISGEQLFKPLQSADIIDNAVFLKWDVTQGLTKITVTPQGGQSFDVALNATDLTTGQKIISGLLSNTTYSAELYEGSKSRGYLVFKTNLPLAGNIVDLRGIEGRPSVMADTLPTVPSGSTIILKKGQSYDIATTVLLDKSITIVSGDDLSVPTQAIINITAGSAFNIVANSNIEYLKFKNVTLRSDSYASKYVFNINTACSIGTLSFESCRAEIFRGLVRTQTSPALITNFSINECILDSLAGYGVLTVDVSTSKVDNISIRNSTIYKAEKVITSKNNSTSLLFENCTVNEAPKGSSNYFIDYSNSSTLYDVSQGITINNCIFGIGKYNGGSTLVRGIKAGINTAKNVSNSYNTSDYVVQPTYEGIPNLTPYSGASTDLWQDPYNGNFGIKALDFAGKNTSGDPRWRP